MMVMSWERELNDDVVMEEILARLPAESLCRFKSVSRLWRDFISSSTFIQRHASAHRHDGGGALVGFLQEAAVHETSETLTAKHCNTLTLTLTSCCKGEGEGAGLKLKIPRHVGNFINSSNGLILCSRIRGSLVTYYVGNPLTGKFVELPPPPHGKYCLTIESYAYGRYGRMYSESTVRKPPLCSAGLICDTKTNSNSTICNYSVVRAGMNVFRTKDKENIVYFDSYSSETGKWSAMTELVATGYISMLPLTWSDGGVPPLVANGIVHWYTELGKYLAVYDPKAGDTHIQLIDLPKNDSYAITRSTDDDVLCLGLVRAQNIMFYTLPKTTKINGGGGYKRQVNIDSNEWVLMRDVSIPTLCSSKRRGRRSTAAGLVACKKTTLEFLIPGTTALEVAALLRQDDKVFLYNLQNNSIQNLDYCGRINQHNKLAPYFRSSSLTSYCL